MFDTKKSPMEYLGKILSELGTVFTMGEKCLDSRKKQEFLSSWVFLIALAILVLWIIKMLLKIDPPFEDLLANVPGNVFLALSIYHHFLTFFH